MARLQERADIDLSLTRFQNFWMPELAAEERRYQDHPLSQPSDAWSVCTLLASRTVFERFSFHDGDRALEDMIWFLRVAEQGATIDVLPDVLMYRRFHLGSNTRRGRAEYFDEFLPILRAWRDYQRQRKGR